MCRLAALALAMVPAVVVAAGTHFATGAPIALTGSDASPLFKQCSREAPTPSEILGAPNPSEIAALEAHVARYLANLVKSGKRVPPAMTYGRQYVSFMEGGRRKIYGNFFPQSVERQQPIRRAVIVCDGGARYWGIVYDPEREAVERLEMNGEA